MAIRSLTIPLALARSDDVGSNFAVKSDTPFATPFSTRCRMHVPTCQFRGIFAVLDAAHRICASPFIPYDLKLDDLAYSRNLQLSDDQLASFDLRLAHGIFVSLPHRIFAFPLFACYLKRPLRDLSADRLADSFDGFSLFSAWARKQDTSLTRSLQKTCTCV